MIPQLTTYVTLICTSGVLNLYLSIYVFLKRHHYKKIANFFVLYTSSITIYCFASAFGLLATDFEQMKFWSSMVYLGMPFGPPLGLMFILEYFGINLTKKQVYALLAIPFVSFLMVSTNDYHHLFYRVFEVDPKLGIPFYHQEIGIWYMIHGVFIFACMFVAFLLVLFRWRETARVYRRQLISLAAGQFVPMATAFLYLIGATPEGIDPVPMMLCLSSLLYLWSINTSRMFTLMPVAKDVIFNSINDGVMVLDDGGRLVEFNRACEKMFPELNKSMFGMDFSKVWFLLSGVTLNTSLTTQEVGIGRHIYQVRTSSLEHDKNGKGLLIIFTDITELKSLQRKLEHQAYFDELTQIYNRRAFFEKCARAYAIAKEKSAPFTVVLLDIDYFKKVNDTYGHYVGDQLLIHVANVFKQQLKDGVLFARYGGEEFVLAIEGCTAEQGEELANQLRQDLETHPLMTADGEISVTLSGGVSERSADKEETLFQLLNQADKALYSAKHAGRNQVHIYHG